MYSTIINADQLEPLIGRDTVVFDCRFDLQNPSAGREQYSQGHIPGAYFLDLELDLSAPINARSGRHPLPEIEHFAEILQSSGVQPSSQIVTYDDSGGCFAARAWWIIRALGHESVAVLSNGFSGWQKNQRAIDKRTPPETPGHFIAPKTWQLPLLDYSAVFEALNDKHYVLVDARDNARYNGEHEPIDPIAGHIPGAINKPWFELITDKCISESQTQHVNRWQDLQNKNCVHYCGSGVTACVNVLSQTIATGSVPPLFAGSWSQWCSVYPELIEKR